MTTFVDMRHPSIPSSTTTPARVSAAAVDDWQARGWLLVDPLAAVPDSVYPWATVAQVAAQVGAPGTPIGDAARAAYGSAVVMVGVGIDPTGTTDSTAAMQAKLDALSVGATVFIPAGAYKITTLACDVPVTIIGAGGSLIGDGTLDPIRAVTTLVSTSPTADCLVIGAIGATLRDFALVNESPTTPTAGNGVYLPGGSQAELSAVTVLGFWNNIQISGVYWKINSCHIYDPASVGILVNNQGADYQDHADAGIVNCIISMMYRDYNSAAGIRWVAGGGVRIIGNKINGLGQPGNSNAGMFAYGIDIAPTTSTLVDITINGNSIANYTAAGVQLKQTGSGSVSWFSITANQINAGRGVSSAGVLLAAQDDGHVLQISNGLIASNVLSSMEGHGILVDRATGVHVGENRFSSVAGIQVRIGPGGAPNGAGIRGISASPQNVTMRDNVTLIEDWRDYSNSGGDDGLVDHRYARPFRSTVVNTNQTLFKITPRNNGSVLLKVSLTGYNWSSGRNYVIEQVRALTRVGSGATTVTAVGTDVAAGSAAADVAISYDTVTVSGEVAIKARVTNASFPNADGRVQINMQGEVQRVYRGV